MFKFLFDKKTLEILGVHIIGGNAKEPIHRSDGHDFSCEVIFFIDQFFNYPTFAEGYKISALNGINKLRKSKK